MKVYRHEELLVATYISGPTHNFLGLDFTKNLAPYERDLATENLNKRVDIESVREQVYLAVDEHSKMNKFSPLVVGIQYLSTDTPSDRMYHALAVEILQSLARVEELETFEPTWFP